MSNPVRNCMLALTFVFSAVLVLAQSAGSPGKQQVLDTMKRATMAMEKLSTSHRPRTLKAWSVTATSRFCPEGKR